VFHVFGQVLHFPGDGIEGLDPLLQLSPELLVFGGLPLPVQIPDMFPQHPGLFPAQGCHLFQCHHIFLSLVFSPDKQRTGRLPPGDRIDIAPARIGRKKRQDGPAGCPERGKNTVSEKFLLFFKKGVDILRNVCYSKLRCERPARDSLV
jgi:hypothetical protein